MRLPGSSALQTEWYYTGQVPISKSISGPGWEFNNACKYADLRIMRKDGEMLISICCPGLAGVTLIHPVTVKPSEVWPWLPSPQTEVACQRTGLETDTSYLGLNGNTCDVAHM